MDEIDALLHVELEKHDSEAWYVAGFNAVKAIMKPEIILRDSKLVSKTQYGSAFVKIIFLTIVRKFCLNELILSFQCFSYKVGTYGIFIICTMLFVKFFVSSVHRIHQIHQIYAESGFFTNHSMNSENRTYSVGCSGFSRRSNLGRPKSLADSMRRMFHTFRRNSS